MKPAVRLAGLALLVIAGLIAFQLVGPRSTPSSQPPLARLAPGDIGPVRQAFNDAAGSVRILLLLSPT